MHTHAQTSTCSWRSSARTECSPRHCTIRYLSTARHVAPYAISVPHTARCYRTPRSTIRYLITARHVAPYPISVRDTA
eukprot:1304803-Rhodomonas_salina.1